MDGSVAALAHVGMTDFHPIRSHSQRAALSRRVAGVNRLVIGMHPVHARNAATIVHGLPTSWSPTHHVHVAFLLEVLQTQVRCVCVC